MEIQRLIKTSNVEKYQGLIQELWSDCTNSDAAECIQKSIDDGVMFVAIENEIPVGFAQASLRRDYVEGTASNPVGYLEGVYVAPSFRGHGVGTALILACEDWARQNGCSEFASDCELSNTESQNFHASVGFCEANKIVCYKKSLIE